MKTLPARLITPTLDHRKTGHHHASPAGDAFRIIGRPEQRFVILDEIP